MNYRNAWPKSLVAILLAFFIGTPFQSQLYGAPYHVASAESHTLALGSANRVDTQTCLSNPIPGGGTITFQSNRTGYYELYVIDGSECNIFQLTHDEANAGDPTWSPDGTKLLYPSNGILYMMNADGSDRHQILSSAPAGNHHQRSWSPDGSKIAFNIDIGWQAIYVANIDGTGLKLLASTPRRDNYKPVWTPDGMHIVYSSRTDPGNDGEIAMMEADGSNKHYLMPDNSTIEAYPSISPDGTKIAFVSNRDGGIHIYTMDFDGTSGTNVQRLTTQGTYNGWPHWSPDGTRLVFFSNRDGNNEIYVMNTDGSNQTRITNNPAQDSLPVWGGPGLNHPPSVRIEMENPFTEGAVFQASAIGNDADGDALTYDWDLDNDGWFETPGQSVAAPLLTRDGPSSHLIHVRAMDPGGLSAIRAATVEVHNVAPKVDAITGPDEPVAVNRVLTVGAPFTDPGILDTHTASWEWGDDTTSEGIVNEMNGVGTVNGSHSYREPGLYTIRLTLTDNDGGDGAAVYQPVVVYDADGGFVTGGGWIALSEGAYGPEPSLAGRATVGFSAQYKKGTDTPTGTTEFQFKSAAINFHATAYEWLVVAGHKAMFKGVGTINGVGNYGFLISTIDAKLTPSTDVDLFRIKIWDQDNNDAVVYDSQPGAGDDADPTTLIGGGSIVIHKSARGNATVTATTQDDSSNVRTLYLPIIVAD